jgi:hypothetical protein
MGRLERLMSITYKDLLENLQAMTPEQLNQNVTVYVSGVDEFYSLVQDYPIAVAQPENNDVLDPGHTYLVI